MVPVKLLPHCNTNDPPPALSVTFEFWTTTEWPETAPPESVRSMFWKNVDPLFTKVPPDWMNVPLPPSCVYPPVEVTVNDPLLVNAHPWSNNVLGEAIVTVPSESFTTLRRMYLEPPAPSRAWMVPSLVRAADPNESSINAEPSPFRES